MNLLYEPYVFSFMLSLVISMIYYIYEKNRIDNLDDEEIENEGNLFVKFLMALLISYVIIMILYYSYKYVTFDFKSAMPLTVLSGGAKTILKKDNVTNDEKNIEALIERREKMMERLTIVDDDVDVSILED